MKESRSELTASCGATAPWCRPIESLLPLSGTNLVDRGPPGPCQSLYVHVPFCSDRCTYCAFATVADRPAQHAELVRGLLAELERCPPVSPLQTLYVGGGTPGILHPDLIAQLLQGVQARAPFGERPEITLEVNPSNVDRPRLEAWAAMGINRLSIGIQTFRDDTLSELGRHHDGHEAQRAIELIAQHWPGSWSADLLVGWARQEVSDLERDLSLLLGHSPPHVSVYGLTIEPGTPLWSRRQLGHKVCLNELQMDPLDAIWSNFLTAAGFERYEVSNFAQPGRRSQHNQVYWSNRDCLGLGPGAASTFGDLRWTNIRDTDSWLGHALGRRSTRSHVERLAAEEKLLETLGSGLRTLEGLSLEELDRRFSPHWTDALEPTLSVLEDSGHLRRENGRLRIPAESLIRADSVASSLARALGGSDLGAVPNQAAP